MTTNAAAWSKPSPSGNTTSAAADGAGAAARAPRRRLPQAIFKISSYGHSGGAVWDRVTYVSRDGEVAVEGPNGEQLESLVKIEQLATAWGAGTEDHKRRVLAMNAVVSFPARAFFQAAFADNHDYVFAPHTDATQFHVHMVV